VELPGHRPDPRLEGRLQVQVNVLERGIPFDLPGLDLERQRLQPRGKRLDLVGAQDTGATQPSRMGDRALDVVRREGGVGLDRAREINDPLVGLTRESPAPALYRTLLRGSYRAGCVTAGGIAVTTGIRPR